MQATHFEERTVKLNDAATARFVVKAVDVLGDQPDDLIT